jgi:hypothetical protein
MTTSTLKQQYEFAEDAVELAEIAGVLEKDPDSPDEAMRFGPLLAKTLARENGDDQTVLRAAVKVLRTFDNDDAATWLINEAEIEASMQYGSLPGKAKPVACLLFAIPVVFASFQPPGASLIPNRNFETLHTVISDTQVIAASHGFRLLPSLFTYDELSHLTHHEVLKLTLTLGHQVLESPRETPSIEPLEVRERRFANDVRVDEYPYVQLRFLLGMAATTQGALGELLPRLESEYDDESAQLGLPDEVAATSVGRFDDGTWWTVPFAKLIEGCAQSVTPLLEIGNPAGFHDALRLGAERMRAQDMRLRIEYATEAMGYEASAGRVDVSPLSDGFGNLTGLTLTLYVPNSTEVVDTFMWYRLPHENLTEMRQELASLIDGMDLRGTLQLQSNAALHLH